MNRILVFLILGWTLIGCASKPIAEERLPAAATMAAPAIAVAPAAAAAVPVVPPSPESHEMCIPKVGLRNPVPVCSEENPCDNVYRLTPQGLTGPTNGVTISSYVPDCQSFGADSQTGFNDGPAVKWSKDSSQVERYSCISKNTSTQGPLPLVIFIPGAFGSADDVYNFTSLRQKAETFQLSDAIGVKGFMLVAAQGRNLKEPNSNKNGPHFDDYHRDFNTQSTNPDFQFIDSLVDDLAKKNLINTRRIYIVGWSNGARFAQLYAMARYKTATPGGYYIAAVAAYGLGDPLETFDQSKKNCAHADDTPTDLPMYLINRSCDAATTCDQAQAKAFNSVYEDGFVEWVEKLRSPQKLNNPNVTSVLIDDQAREVKNCQKPKICDPSKNPQTCRKMKVCDASKEPQTARSNSCNPYCLGTLNHMRWPNGVNDHSGHDWESEMLNFLFEHSI